MGKCPADCKKRMEDEGTWRAYCDQRKFCRDRDLDAPDPYNYTMADAESFEKRLSDRASPVSAEETAKEKAPGPEEEIISPPPGPPDKKALLDTELRSLGIAWVAENLENAQLARPQDAPTREAWSLLKTYSKTVDTKMHFFREIWAKVLPAKIERDDGKRGLLRSDRGYHELTELARRLREGFERRRAKLLAGEEDGLQRPA